MPAVSRFLTLHSGAKMPIVGLGTYLLKNSKAAEVVDCALHLGYRHLDTALSYLNEAEIGDVIRDRVQAGKLKRKELFVTTKVPSPFLGKDKVKIAAERSLANLKLKYVDMLLVHMPFGVKYRSDLDNRRISSTVEKELEHYDLLETWAAFEEVHSLGWAHSIGLSNFNRKQIDRIWLASKVKPANLQLECHAYLQQRSLRMFCKEKKIVLSAYGPLGSPGLPHHHSVGVECPDPVLLEEPILQEIANRHKKTAAQILLRFLVQNDVAVLPKASSPARLKENIDIFECCLTEQDLNDLYTLDRNLKYFKFHWAKKHPEYCANEPF